jgi:hypothetical protein
MPKNIHLFYTDVRLIGQAKIWRSEQTMIKYKIMIMFIFDCKNGENEKKS